MEELQTRTADLVEASEAAIRQASALAVSYSFSIIGAIILLVAGYIVAGLVERSIYAGLGSFRGFDETLRRFFAKTARIALLILVGVTVLAQFGVQTASIIAAIGAIGLAIGLALQGTLQNIAAGIMLLALRPFRIGEYIEAGSVSGTVQEIGLFATELKTADGLFVLSPNSELWKAPVRNFSRNQSRRNDLTFAIRHEDDIELALRLLSDTVAADTRVASTPAPSAFVSEVTDLIVNVTVRYWAATSQWWQVKIDLTKAAKQALASHGITTQQPAVNAEAVQGPLSPGQPADDRA